MSILKSVRLLDLESGAACDGFWDVELEKDRIASVQQSEHVDEDAETYGKYLLPGLIDAHVHMIWDGSVDPVATLDRETRNQTLLRAVRHSRETLFLGVTTVRDVGSVDDLAIDLAEAIENGDVIGPTIIASGRTIVMTGGHDPFWGLFADGKDEVLKATRRQIYRGAQVIKVSATGGVYGRSFGESVSDAELNLEELSVIVAEAHKKGLKVAAHAIGYQGIANSVHAGIDTIEHGHQMTPELATELAARNGTVVPTLFVYEQISKSAGIPEYARIKAKEIVAQHKQSVTISREAGLRIVAGSDAGSPLTPHASLQDELLALKAAGLSAAETIQAATSDAAVALDIADHVGVLKPGFTADMTMLDSNPLDDLNVLKTPRRVWKRGIEVTLDRPSAS